MDETNGKNINRKFGSHEADLCQTFAYALYYIPAERKKIALIYLKTEKFTACKKFLYVDRNCSLYIIPFDLETDKFVKRPDNTSKTV
ncbi:MAG: hypothetical protein ACU88J_06140 [Gammaproteobacteria bacterium]